MVGTSDDDASLIGILLHEMMFNIPDSSWTPMRE